MALQIDLADLFARPCVDNGEPARTETRENKILNWINPEIIGIGLEFHPRDGRKVASAENTERSIAPIADENAING
jgi:hypothetical protein